MANIRNANTIYIDTASASGNTSVGTTGNFDVPGIKVKGLIVTPTSGDATLALKDVTTGATKLQAEAPNSDGSRHFDFSDDPIVFPNGIAPTTVTTCVATLIVTESRG